MRIPTLHKLIRKSTFLLAIFISPLLYSQTPGDKVISVFVDEYGCPWFGTDNGLLRKCGNTWKAYPVQPDSPGIVNDIEHLSSSSGNEIWIGTMDGILKIKYSENELTFFKRFSSETNSFLSDIIKGITIDKYATLFFATPSGIGILTISSAWKFINRVQDILENQFTSADSENDTIYLGTIGEGVARLVRSADAYTGASSFFAPWSGIPGNDITTIFTDSKGNQWFGSEFGLSYHLKSDAKEGWDESYTKYLPDMNVSVIREDKNGNIWVGTHGGLVRFKDGKTGVPDIFTTADGLPSDIINDLFITPDGFFWVGTDMGASFFDGSGFKNFRTSDHLREFPRFKKLLKLKKI